MEFLRRNKFLIGAIAIILVISSIYFLSPSKPPNSSQPPVVNPSPTTQVINAKNPEDIGLTLSTRSDKKAIVMVISKLSSISSLEYEVTYDADVVDEGQTLRVGRGIGPSTIEIKSTDREIKREIELGTCSKNVCKHDKGIKEANFVLKINYANGEVGSIQQKITL